MELWFSLARYKSGGCGIILLFPQLPIRLLFLALLAPASPVLPEPFRELPVTLPFLSFTKAAVLLYFCIYNKPLAPALDSIFWSLFKSDHFFSHTIGLCNTFATRQSALLKHALQIVTFDLISFSDTPKHCCLSLTLALVLLWPSTKALSSRSEKYCQKRSGFLIEISNQPLAQHFVLISQSYVYAVSSPLRCRAHHHPLQEIATTFVGHRQT